MDKKQKCLESGCVHVDTVTNRCRVLGINLRTVYETCGCFAQVETAQRHVIKRCENGLYLCSCMGGNSEIGTMTPNDINVHLIKVQTERILELTQLLGAMTGQRDFLFNAVKTAVTKAEFNSDIQKYLSTILQMSAKNDKTNKILS